MKRDPTFRPRVLAASEGCAECGCTEGPFIADHIHQLATGGADDPSNGQKLCVECNKPKTKADAQVRAKIRRIRRKWYGENTSKRVPW